MADEGELKGVLAGCGLDGGLLALSQDAAFSAEYERFTQEAIERDVFGAPTYVVDGEPFWGQDRLDLLDWRLSR